MNSWSNVKPKTLKRVWGCHVHRVTRSFGRNQGGDCLPYAFIRKPYTRTHPYPGHIMRIPPMQREKAAFIKLRKDWGYPINMLAKVSGRSTSFIHRILRTAVLRLKFRWIDMRKLPAKARQYFSGFRWRKLQKMWPMWEAWILGEGEKPP